MDGLLTFLIFAALFYFMMRVGCGAHMVHGHGARHGAGHGDESSNADNDIDPVCGEEIPSTEGYGKMHSGRLHRFCSRKCLDAFEADPERYIGEQKEAVG